MTDLQRLQDLARALAAANADVSEMFAAELGRAARSAKVGGMGHGIVVRHNSLTGGLEVRGGVLMNYVEGRPAGDGWEEAGV
jgi:hypothetical protein